MDQPIVVFDSGLGGITLLVEALAYLPRENFVYFGDNLHVPYGKKDPDQIRSLMDQLMDKIRPLNPKALVLACNTATVSSANYLREKYDLPIIGIEPAIKPALTDPDGLDKRVLLLATEVTSRSEKLARLALDLDLKHRLDILPAQDLVTFAEKLQFLDQEVWEDVETVFSSFDFQDYGSIVLGCTHFIWYRELFTKLLPPHVKLVDGNQGTVRQLARRISGQENQKNQGGRGWLKLYFSHTLADPVKNFLQAEIPRDFDYIDL